MFFQVDWCESIGQLFFAFMFEISLEVNYFKTVPNFVFNKDNL